MKAYTKKQLVQAMQKYNAEAIDNPDDFEDYSKGEDCAEAQVDKLISFIEK